MSAINDPADYGKVVMTQEDLDNFKNMTAKPSGYWTTTTTTSPMTLGGPMAGGSNVVYKPYVIAEEREGPSQAMKEEDAKRHMKIFLHFAKVFIERFPKWEVLPEPEDPFHKVKLVRRDLGAAIFTLYPDNQVGVFGGPDQWTRKNNDDPQHVMARIQTQNFYGWALGMSDAPDWL